MLAFLSNTVVTILTTYLAFANLLADQALTIINDSQLANHTVSHEVTDAGEVTPEDVPYAVDFLSILANQAAEQSASVIESADSESEETAAASSSPLTLSAPASLAETTVNIYCTYSTDKYVRATTGSGFIVRDNGVILTNAHVAMFLLLKDVTDIGTTECIVRTGDPATATYNAELLYISPTWVNNNAQVISERKPHGTGERDYAFLYITDRLDGSALPNHFPYLPVSTDLLGNSDVGHTVLVGGYPATEAMVESGNLILHQALATTTIANIYTFGSSYGDLLSLGGTSVGQHGASGGPVVDTNGRAIGLISTRGNDKKNGVGSLNAITTSYIHRTLLEETSFGFGPTTSGDLSYRAQVFRDNLRPFLTTIVANEL